MYKKLSIIFASILLFCIVGFVICVPIGIRDTLSNVNKLLSSTSFVSEKVALEPTIDTIQLDMDYYQDILLKQSQDDTIYIELFEPELQHSSLKFNYAEENKVHIYTERTFGNISLNQENIEKLLVKRIEGYPDAIIYLPKNVSLLTNHTYLIDSHLDFKNKSELLNIDPS